MWYLYFLLFISYVGMTYHSLRQSAAPMYKCKGEQCFGPLVSEGDLLTLELWLYQPFNGTKTYKWSPIKSCRLNFTIPESGKLPTQLTNNETICEVPIPDAARHRSPNKKAVKPLKARFLISSDEAVVATVPFDLTRVKERQPGTFWSSSSSSKSTEARNLLNDSPLKNKTRKEEPKEPMWIPYLKYGRAPIRVRIVAEYREFGVLVRNDGLEIPVWNHTTYRPLIYVDDLSLQHSAQSELAPPEDNKPPVKLQIKLNSVSPIVDAFIRQMYTAFSTVEAMLQGEEMDEIRYFLSDERLYRFVLTQLISYVHMWLDYLAFRDEVRFYKGKQNFSGISTSTVLTRLICSIIILLYLLDGGGTSWVVLLSLFGSCSVEAWKVCKLLRPTLKPRFPFISIRHLQTVNEQETAEYDRIASTNLAMILYPLVIGWSLYALQHYEYTSWYSWLISNLANAVYTFGFISLCPQLYVNYRLKSVAHLPWKVFMYKLFNTFVDDAFAWLIEMPWKHRIMTLRDDVVFLMFLVQVFIYRVDKKRTNEFGFSYEQEAQNAIQAPEKGKIEEPKEKKE